MSHESVAMLEAFLADEAAFEMFLTGQAGTGKTTETRHLVEYLQAKNILYIVCAFTHKACGILASKLPEGANIDTLHKYLKKRPGLNTHATKVKQLDISIKGGTSERPTIVIVDEFSMVGERDYLDLLEMQDSEEGTLPTIKTLYVGDVYQLPPVGDLQTINPKKPYWLQLQVVHRTSYNDLLDAMTSIVQMIKGAKLTPLKSSKHFLRGQDIVQSYRASFTDSKKILAWTNQAVEELNVAVEGHSSPYPGCTVHCPSLQTTFIFDGEPLPWEIQAITTQTGLLQRESKFKTLEYLFKQEEISFCQVKNSEGNLENLAYVFGTNTYKNLLKSLSLAATKANQAIHKKFPGASPAVWAKDNYNHKLAKVRSQAWRKLIAVRDNVVCLDFDHATTVHKSQGSTYSEVYLDIRDLAKCLATNKTLYLRLAYVAISRAAQLVVTN